MTRRRVTIELDGNLVEAARSVAERSGVAEGALYERALREVLVRDFAALMDEIDRYQADEDLTLSDDEALELATAELKAMRAERRNAS
jgi:hypothetical protein